MTAKIYQPGESCAYPLVLKQLLTTPLIYSPDQEIVYRDKFRGRLSKFAVPERFEFVDAIPKTRVGKLNKRVIRQQHN